MRLRTTILLFALTSVGCHRCGDPDPVEMGTTTFGAETCDDFCFGDSSGAVSFTTSPPPSSSSSSGAGEDTAAQDECLMSSECGAGLFCVAPFDQSLGPEGKGLYACVSECVPFMEETMWCADATACCDPSHVCTDRGYCVPPELDTGSDSGGSDSGGSDSGGSDSGSSDVTGSGDDSGSTSGSTGG